MLKALELSGFKSFADRARFEFPPGISVVVGPNGSGKSNIVDAIKWVLGSQSAKSLRGKEMTDVIFNGCASRAPLGTGEATLTFNNDGGQLPIDAKEVHVTRRVYRSGEGEYLINRQPCRLRDIRELLAGTGITTEAYCIIEQGKVDSLLQSSPRDRRVIFEEAAGISQFKQKKATSLRRLERVEQNLLRLSDIVDEVESRLRSVRSQAGKAHRYRECAARLQTLRTDIGLIDWRELTSQLAAKDEQSSTLASRYQERALQLAELESKAADVERELEAVLARVRKIEAAASGTREQIAACQATIDHQRAGRADLQQEVMRARQQLAAMSASPEESTHPHRDPTAELRAAEAELQAANAASCELVEKQHRSAARIEELRATLEALTADQGEALRSAVLLESQLGRLESQRAALNAGQAARSAQRSKLWEQHQALAEEIAEHESSENSLAAQVAKLHSVLAAAERQRDHLRSELSRTDKQHRQLEGRLARTRERMAVLSELEVRLEGLDGGVQQVIRMAREAPDGPLGKICGVVADLFHVDVDTAPLIEVALGERAQFIVIPTGEPIIEQLDRETIQVAGRVGFLRLDARAPVTALANVDLSYEPGVMGRADRFVETGPEFAGLARRLLGQTWLVDSLATALQLAQSAGRGLDFVTSDSELLTADGTLIIGPRRAVTGMLSRRSELRACDQLVVELEKQLAHYDALYARLDQERVRHEAALASDVATLAQLSNELSQLRQLSSAARGGMQHATGELDRLTEEIEAVDQETAAIEATRADLRQQHAAAQELAARAESMIDAQRAQLAIDEQHHAQLQNDATIAQVATARCEQRVEMLRQQAEQAERNQQQRQRALADTRQRLTIRQAKLAELDHAMLAGRQALAQWFLEKEKYAAELNAENGEVDSLRRRRAAVQEQISLQRQQLSTVQAQQHKLEVAASRLRLERKTLCERMHDDYGIDLAAEAVSREQGNSDAPRSVLPAPIDRGGVEREIADLREQLSNIGAVNLHALDELESLETRFGTISQQYRDLVDAKASLERIIQRINVDSRQLFLTTLETIRGHFQELFRRLFGGGEADIVVEDTDDALESGIEIVARPPGKEACIISLLSGGEKTLTCVALLLAVFRSKPSPFCVLDEVDAALDESNIGRFVSVLREFLSFTQFIVVTHSKKTMSGADTLYGVTMEESGVSKRVSVRFEDVSEDGHIVPSALATGRPQPASTAAVSAIGGDAPARRAA